MSETFNHQRNISLITLEGLRDFVKSKTPFEYKFVLVGFSPSSRVPQYQMFITVGGERHILVAAKMDKNGPKPRLLHLYPAITSIHQEFGNGRHLDIYVDKESVSEKRIL